MEIAVTRRFQEVLAILAEFTEITDKVKLLRMSVIIDSVPDYGREEFQSILKSLPLDLVRIYFQI